MMLWGLPVGIVILSALGVAVICFSLLAIIRRERRVRQRKVEKAPVADRFIAAVRQPTATRGLHEPTRPKIGDTWWVPTTDRVYWHDGTGWLLVRQAPVEVTYSKVYYDPPSGKVIPTPSRCEIQFNGTRAECYIHDTEFDSRGTCPMKEI